LLADHGEEVAAAVVLRGRGQCGEDGVEVVDLVPGFRSDPGGQPLAGDEVGHSSAHAVPPGGVAVAQAAKPGHGLWEGQ
jgi:hypothetical protein